MQVAPNARRLVRIAGAVLWLSTGLPAMLLMWLAEEYREAMYVIATIVGLIPVVAALVYLARACS